MKFKSINWNRLVDIITIIWFISFCLSFFTKGYISKVFDILSIFICIFFVIDLLIIYKKSINLFSFIKENWFDILMAIPFFRFLKIFRLAKVGKLRNILKLLKKINFLKHTEQTIEFIDLSSKSHERIKKRMVRNGSNTQKS